MDMGYSGSNQPSQRNISNMFNHRQLAGLSVCRSFHIELSHWTRSPKLKSSLNSINYVLLLNYQGLLVFFSSFHFFVSFSLEKWTHITPPCRNFNHFLNAIYFVFVVVVVVVVNFSSSSSAFFTFLPQKWQGVMPFFFHWILSKFYLIKFHINLIDLRTRLIT